MECSWIDKELRGISLKDIRLVKRFKYILKKFMQQAQSNISSCFDSWSSIKGCYRFFSNNKVDKNVIIQENSTISRIEESTGKIFIAHDTTYIDYKKHKKNGTLDRIFSYGKEKESNLGWILHNSLALTASGIPLGVINQKFVRHKTIKHPDRKISSKKL